MEIIEYAWFSGDPGVHLLVLAAEGRHATIWSLRGPSPDGPLRRTVHLRADRGLAAPTFRRLARGDSDRLPCSAPLPAALERRLDTAARRGEAVSPGRPVPRRSHPGRLAWPVMASAADWNRAIGDPRVAVQAWPHGERALLIVDRDGAASLVCHRPGEDRADRLIGPDQPEAAGLLGGLGRATDPPRGLTVDGILGEHGGRPAYWLTDLLRYRGGWLVGRPFWERQALLLQLYDELGSDRPRGWRHDLAGRPPGGLRLDRLAGPVAALRDLDAPYAGQGRPFCLAGLVGA